MKILLSTHGMMASGMRTSLNILLGDTDCLTVFDAYINDETVESHVKKFLNEVGTDELKVLVSDMYGGSVFQVMAQYMNYPNTVIITGVNLNLLMALVLEQERIKSIEDFAELINNARAMLRMVTQQDLETVDDNEFY